MTLQASQGMAEECVLCTLATECTHTHVHTCTQSYTYNKALRASQGMAKERILCTHATHTHVHKCVYTQIYTYNNALRASHGMEEEHVQPIAFGVSFLQSQISLDDLVL